MSTDTPATPSIGRNEPCPCGSQKKYKRCCGENAAPKLSVAATPSAAPGAMPPGMENVDPALMSQATQALQRLPRPQLQKLQSLMQRAMAGKDVSQEAAAFEKMLPPEFQSMMQGLAMQMGGMPGMHGMTQGMGMPSAAETAPAVEIPAAPSEMSVEEAKKIIEAAASAGKISTDEAQKLLTVEPEQKSGVGKFWRGLTGKK